jgi:hypothetical protein
MYGNIEWFFAGRYVAAILVIEDIMDMNVLLLLRRM